MPFGDDAQIESLMYMIDSMTRDRLIDLRDRIMALIEENRPDPKWPGGLNLWHKVWKQRVRAIYGEAEDNYAVEVCWDMERGEWKYRDKYCGQEMWESDLEEFDEEKERAVILEREQLRNGVL